MKSKMTVQSVIRGFVTEVIFSKAQDTTTTHTVMNELKKVKGTQVSFFKTSRVCALAVMDVLRQLQGST